MGKDYGRAIGLAARVLDGWLPHKIRYDRLPALSAGIMHGGKLVYARGFGLADVASGRPATAETCYRIASISKSFTAVAVLQLAAKGKLRLDDPIQRHLPWFRARVGRSSAAALTIRQALSHTAGVFRDGITPHWETGAFPDLAGLKASVPRALVVENLTRFKYSNFGYALLGQAIAKAAGTTYDRYVMRAIVRKLGMTRTAPDLTRASLAWLATGYSRPIPDVPRAAFGHEATRAYAPATGFLSNVPDLARYLAALSLARNAGAILDRESRKEMMREHWATGEGSESYALGLAVNRIEGRRIVGHGGGFPGFITQVALDHENDIGVIVLTNTNDSTAGPIATGILETIYRLADEPERFDAGPRLAGARYAGCYRSRWEDQVVVALDRTLLAFGAQVHSPGRFGTVLRPAGRHRFVMDSRMNYASPGELATFTVPAGRRRAARLLWGAQPAERLDG